MCLAIPGKIIEIEGHGYTWKSFKTDKRGAIITGRITEYEGENTIAYFRTIIESEQEQMVTLHFTTTDELTLFLNGKDFGRVYRDGYVSKGNDWNAWYDFWENPKHSGRLVKLSLAKGKNQLVIRVRNGQFASGGFFVHLESPRRRKAVCNGVIILNQLKIILNRFIDTIQETTDLPQVHSVHGL